MRLALRIGQQEIFLAPAIEAFLETERDARMSMNAKMSTSHTIATRTQIARTP
jgi:hypothetical protein